MDGTDRARTRSGIGYSMRGINANLGDSGQYNTVDKITKEDLLRLVNLTLKDDVEFDEYDENAIKNKAHQIVYKSIVEKLRSLTLGRRWKEAVSCAVG
jgi:hypothetical protein